MCSLNIYTHTYLNFEAPFHTAGGRGVESRSVCFRIGRLFCKRRFYHSSSNEQHRTTCTEEPQASIYIYIYIYIHTYIHVYMCVYIYIYIMHISPKPGAVKRLRALPESRGHKVAVLICVYMYTYII